MGEPQISVRVIRHVERFKTKIAGVTHQNADGSDRQTLIKTLRPGEELKLVREPDNPYDKCAIAVFKLSGEQLGYTHGGDSLLAGHIDGGGRASARVVAVVGGPGILGLVFRAFRKSYGCVIEISKHDPDWKEVTPYLDASKQIEQMIRDARAQEAADPQKAIAMYRDAVTRIVAFDKAGPHAPAWRRVRHPINRLSHLLEKGGQTQDAYDEIVAYERFNDVFGLLSTDAKGVTARKQRLSKQLHVKSEIGSVR